MIALVYKKLFWQDILQTSYVLIDFTTFRWEKTIYHALSVTQLFVFCYIDPCFFSLLPFFHVTRKKGSSNIPHTKSSYELNDIYGSNEMIINKMW